MCTLRKPRPVSQTLAQSHLGYARKLNITVKLRMYSPYVYEKKERNGWHKMGEPKTEAEVRCVHESNYVLALSPAPSGLAYNR